MTTVNRANAQQQDGLWKGPLIGGLIGTFFNQPILGALGGLVYKLLGTEGMAESAKKLVGEFAGSDDPLKSLGNVLGGKSQAASAEAGERPATEQRSGLPTWAKWGIGIAAGAAALNFAQDNLFSTFFGMPGFGMGMGMGFGMGMPFGNMWNPNMPLWGGGGFFPYW